MKSYRFTPSIAATAGFLVLMPLLVSLGIWQLARAKEKQTLIDLQGSRMPDQAVRLTGNEDNLDALRYRHVVASGVYDDDHQFLVDNRIVQGRTGYFAMTPLKLTDDSAVLINRGWLPAGPSRDQLPDLTVNARRVTVSGTVNSFPSVGIRLEGAEIPAPGWPAVLQVVDADYLSGVLGYRILPFQIYLDPSEPDGYRREWDLRAPLNPDRHRAYAVQWFGLAVALLFIYVGYGVKRESGPPRGTPT